MPYVEDDNGNHIIDDDGNKIIFSVSYEVDNTTYVHREMLHIDDDGHINTENRNLVIKDGVNANHAVSKGQLDNTKTNIIELIKSSIQTALNKFSSDLFKFINNRMKGRVGKKTLTIPKTNYTWIKLLDASEIDGITSLQDILIQDIFIKRTNRYHHAKSSHVANAFTNLEFFFKADFSEYYCYFDNHPSNWLMDCFFNYVKIPKEISVEDSDEEVNE